jgi:hypothetical protein
LAQRQQRASTTQRLRQFSGNQSVWWRLVANDHEL